jgi:hypothetical protein
VSETEQQHHEDELRQAPPTEEELRAAYEAELKRIRVEQVLMEGVVALINLGMRRTGLAPGTESERDPEQVRIAIEAVRAQVPVIEQIAPSQARSVRDALSQMQLAYVKIGGGPAQPAGAPATPGGPGAATPGGPGPATPGGPGAAAPETGQPAPEPAKPGEPGPAQRSGRLWVPGQ